MIWKINFSVLGMLETRAIYYNGFVYQAKNVKWANIFPREERVGIYEHMKRNGKWKMRMNYTES